METTTPNIQHILDKVYGLEKSIGNIDHSKFEQFIKSIINGDTLVTFLVLLATYGEKNEDCIIIYILTSGKLAKVRIVSGDFNSESAYLNQVVGVNKSVLKDKENNATITVEFPQGRFGLIYPLSNADIDAFFQKVDMGVRKQRQGKPNEQ